MGYDGNGAPKYYSSECWAFFIEKGYERAPEDFKRINRTIAFAYGAPIAAAFEKNEKNIWPDYYQEPFSA